MKILELRPNPPILLDSLIRFSCQLIRRNDGDTESVSELWYEISKEIDISWRREDVEPYLIATILLAMQEERGVVAKGSVSSELLSNLTEFCDFWNNCLPKLFKKINIECESIERPGEIKPIHKAIAAFSGGLDATFLVWRHIKKKAGYRTQPLSCCAMIHGFDIPLPMDEFFNVSFSVAKKTLETVGLPLIRIRTNILEAVPVHLVYAHGTFLVSSLQFLKSKFDVVLIASSEPYSNLSISWGSSPLTDHLLSSGCFKVMHDGAGYTRPEKAKFISEWTEGMSNLRVCTETRDIHWLNCGRCEKCVRTMACFAVHRLPIPKCLNGSLDVLNARIKSLRLHSPAYNADWINLIKIAKQNKINERWVKWIPLLFLKNKIRQIRKRVKGYLSSRSLAKGKK